MVSTEEQTGLSAEASKSLHSVTTLDDTDHSTRSRAPLTFTQSISPTEQPFSAADIQHDFEKVRDSLARIPVPSGLKVNDSISGIKQNCRPALKILAKCARF